MKNLLFLFIAVILSCNTPQETVVIPKFTPINYDTLSITYAARDIETQADTFIIMRYIDTVTMSYILYVDSLNNVKYAEDVQIRRIMPDNYFFYGTGFEVLNVKGIKRILMTHLNE